MEKRAREGGNGLQVSEYLTRNRRMQIWHLLMGRGNLIFLYFCRKTHEKQYENMVETQ